MGGYAYGRDIELDNVVYIKYDGVEDFHDRFKERYHNDKGEIHVPFVPTVTGKRVELNKDNYKNFYEVGDKSFEKLSKKTILNKKEDLEKTILEIGDYIEEKFYEGRPKKLKKGDMVVYSYDLKEDHWTIMSEPVEGKMVSIINGRTGRTTLVDISDLTNIVDLPKKPSSNVQPGYYD